MLNPFESVLERFAIKLFELLHPEPPYIFFASTDSSLFLPFHPEHQWWRKFLFHLIFLQELPLLQSFSSYIFFRKYPYQVFGH
jgi:hypothetical protein